LPSGPPPLSFCVIAGKGEEAMDYNPFNGDGWWITLLGLAVLVCLFYKVWKSG
jgi:hypothetical protein